jgi:RNA polymerase-associated protein RTF1
METENGKRFVTTQYALAKHGKAEKEWPFIIFSNAPLTLVR